MAEGIAQDASLEPDAAPFGDAVPAQDVARGIDKSGNERAQSNPACRLGRTGTGHTAQCKLPLPLADGRYCHHSLGSLSETAMLKGPNSRSTADAASKMSAS